MYGALWRRLPGRWPAKALQSALLGFATVALCFLWVFPAIAPYMPFNETTVDEEGAGTPSSRPTTTGTTTTPTRTTTGVATPTAPPSGSATPTSPTATTTPGPSLVPTGGPFGPQPQPSPAP